MLSSGIPEVLRINYGYHDNQHSPEGRMKSFFSKGFPEIDPKTILDAGCSYGYSIVDIANYYKKAKVIGIEQFQNRISNSNLALPKDLKERVFFYNKDFFNLNLPDDEIKEPSFDAVFMINNFYYSIRSTFSDVLRNRVASIKNLLSEGGHLIIGAEIGEEDYWRPCYYVLVKEKNIFRLKDKQLGCYNAWIDNKVKLFAYTFEEYFLEK